MGSIGDIVIIIVAVVAVICLVVLFFVVEVLSKGNLAKRSGAKKVASDVVKPEAAGVVKDSSEIAVTTGEGSNLASEMEALIVERSSQRDDKVETASQRSRMHNRRARMLEYYDKKYKSRTVIFEPDSFDEPVSSSQSTAFVVDGVEITREDVKKLTALNDLLARKTSGE